VGSAALVLTFFATGTPLPLYNDYRARLGISGADIALITVIYTATTAATLLFLGRLSDHLGRRPVGIAAMLSSVAGVVILMSAASLPMLILGRALQGVACGVVSSTLGSYVIETAPERPHWLPAVITGIGPVFAIPVGSLAAGVLVQYGPAPRVLAYGVAAGLLIACSGLLLLCPETAPTRSLSSAAQAIRPRLRVPHGLGRPLLVAGATLLATWSFGGFFQGFAPTLAADRLHTDNALLVAVAYASLQIPGPAGGSATGRLPHGFALRVGLGVFAAFSVLVAAATASGSFAGFVAASMIAGLGVGAASGGSMRGVLERTNSQDRASVLALVYLMAYLSAAIPGLISSRLAGHVSLVDITYGQATLVVVAAAVAWAASLCRTRPDPDPAADA